MNRTNIFLTMALVIVVATFVSADDTVGLNPGDKAPEFNLKNQAGKDVKLSELLKKGNVALVFYRSADWWSFCKKQLVQLEAVNDKYVDAKMQVVGVSYDSVEILEKFSTKSKLSYDLLSDVESATIKDYHLHFKKGLAAPATIVIDRKGVVRAKLRHDSYRERHTTDELLEVAQKLK